MSVSLKSILIAMFSILIIASCGIYEDGPAFSIKTKRMIGEWELTSFNEGNEILSYKDVHAAEVDGCGTRTIYDKIFKEQNVVWDMESYYDLKERYNLVELKHNYAESYIAPSFTPKYITLDSSANTEVRRWSFNNNKEELTITEAGDHEEYQILRLTNKELKLADVDGNILSVY
ncbi:MAG: hypothetical protein P8I55_03435 [Crocinitomix sp.]|nr:hypothetical protein [Crocinitomix sp.]|tara:strand:- start:60 stop:584 length:525 start_codon:yes stop_codon:yes gene_type:complete